MKASMSTARVFPETLKSDEVSSLSNTFQQANLSHIENIKEPSSFFLRQRFNSITIEKFLDSKTTVTVMTIATIFALFEDDVKTLGFPKSSDETFSSLMVVCLFLFALELILSYFFKKNYKWSFYFWLDFISTVSLITDITWIWNSLIGVSNGSSSKSQQLQNASKTSRAGTRTSRVLRIIRLIRLIRLVKLYKNAQIALKNKILDEADEVEETGNESRVGKKLSEQTMKRVILIVLIMLVVLPFFDSDFYFTQQTSWDFGVMQMDEFSNMQGFEAVKDEFINYHMNDIRPLIYLTHSNITGDYAWQNGISYSDLRYDEIYYSSYGSFIAIFDTRYDAKMTSLLDIFKTLFICIVLTLGAIYFTKDSEELVIKPIERIISKIKKIAKNPMTAADMKLSVEDLSLGLKNCCFCFKIQKNNKKTPDYETRVIENTIVKIGVLLALGFGEAGSSIIGSNIERSGEIDPLMIGNKLVAIFGFCDIRNFTDTTEELQEGVMLFVNEIGLIIHGFVEKYSGAPNKNIGDAFLLVWKFSSEEFYLEEETILRNPQSPKAHYVPDLALLCFLKIMAKINKDPAILKYRANQHLLMRMPNYEVKMGFGLHLGWAIEGAIGSQFKVDPSYLSPHVNLASSLEAITKVYGVPLLLSGALYVMLSYSVQLHCRAVDIVNIKGISKAVALYTCDCDLTGFSPSKVVARKKEVFRRKSKNLRRKLEDGEITVGELFSKSKDVQMLRKGFSPDFFEAFHEGFLNYIEGNWTQAKILLEKALEKRAKDGPSLSLMNYMSDFAFRSPQSWTKCRVLA